MKVNLKFETRMTLRNQIEYWYNKAMAPFGVVALFAGNVANNSILFLVAGVMITLGFLTEIHFTDDKEEKKP